MSVVVEGILSGRSLQSNLFGVFRKIGHIKLVGTLGLLVLKPPEEKGTIEKEDRNIKGLTWASGFEPSLSALKGPNSAWRP